MRQGRTFRTVLLATSALVPLGLAPAYSNPQGGQVVGGSASIATQGSTTTITQTTDRAVINWNTFNIGSGETTRFIQPGAGSIALNRVTGGLGPSTIYGTLTANGQVWIINPAGILIGSGAVVNTAGFLATTSDIKNSDFMAGRYEFIIPGRPDASVVNLGTITATNGGFAALVAPGVRNSGTITARFGKVSLASGNTFSLDFYGDSLITLGVSDSIAGQVKDVATGLTLTSLVQNEGKLSANGGKVELTAVAARQVVDSVINNKGVIEARSIGHRNGMIVLGGPTSKTKVAGSPVQTVKVSGTLNVSGKKKGGTVKVTGENIELASATINASGGTGGGTVMIGGDTGGGNPNSLITGSIPKAQLSSSPVPTADTVSVDGNSVIDVSATKAGDGGKAIVWSDTKTVFAGTVLAKGGAQSGNGGFVEVSGKQLTYSGYADTRAPNGSNGWLLLDPTDVTVDSVYAATIMYNLVGGNVLVTTSAAGGDDGNITVNAPITWTSANTLTLSADNNIHINAAITGTSGGLTLNAYAAIDASGAVNVGRFTLQNGSWSQIGSSLPAFSASDFRIEGGSFLRAAGGLGTNLSPYQIVDIYGLQGIGSSSVLLSRSFQLAQNIDATGTASWNEGAGFTPIGNGNTPFTGKLNGQGYTIDGLTIVSSDAAVGLFGVSNGTLQNIGLTNVNVKLTGTYQFAGALAGDNGGTIANAYATGSLGNDADASIASATGAYGGLVGVNRLGGSVSQSHAAVAVHSTGPDSGYLDAGGLVGQNHGSISQSYATGPVTATYSSISGTYLGGLVGWHREGTIEQSYATGSVTGVGAFGALGGLVGVSSGAVSQSYASGAVSYTGNSSKGGGLVASNSGSVAQSYATGSVTGSGDNGYGAGLVGFSSGTVDQSYSSGKVIVTGINSVAGGLVASGSGAITDSYWDKDTSGQTDSAGGVGLSTGAARQHLSFVGWNFDNDWFMIDGQTRPFLRSEYSTTITNAHQLQLMAINMSANYTLANDIDLGPSLAAVSGQYTGMWGAQGFSPIGNSPFLGQFDGNYFKIDHLVMAPTSNTVSLTGLFGVIGSTGVVQNLDLTHAALTSNPSLSSTYQYLGILAGINYGTVSGVNVSGTINGGSFGGLVVGGLVGMNGNFNGSTVAQGTIQNSSANVIINTGDGVACFSGNCTVGFNLVGGLVGSNPGVIEGSHADGNIVVGANTTAGGLVGSNQMFNDVLTVQPVIRNSWATGDVSSDGINVQLGGLAGYNGGNNGPNKQYSALIENSRATGDVSANAAIAQNSCNGGSGDCQFSNAGGLVGFNQGFIQGTVPPVVNENPRNGTGTYATGDVYVGSSGVAGGLVGQNDGVITSALAKGDVTGAAGVAGTHGSNSDRMTTLGGFVGQNQGQISDSSATGKVGGAYVAYLQVGGFVGSSGGAIDSSHASGEVKAGNNSTAGGFAGDSSSFSDDNCNGCIRGVGYDNTGKLTGVTASGAVTVGSVSAAGGLVAFASDIGNSSASGTVTGGDNSLLGGLVGVVNTDGLIANSHSTSRVIGTGGNNWIGGLAAVNAGIISLSSSAGGNVEGTSDSVVGGLVGVNIGIITGTSTLSSQTVSVSGTNNLVGGLVGANFGAVFLSTANGNVTGGAGNTMGSLLGANGNIANVAPNLIPGSSFPLGTVVASAGTGSVNGNPGPQIGSTLAKMPPAPSIVRQCDDVLCKILVDPPTIPAPLTPVVDIPQDVLATAVILSLLTTDNKADQAAITSALITVPSSSTPAPGGQGGTNVNTASTGGSTGVRTVSQTPGAPPPPPPPPPLRPVAGPDGERFSSIPPITENRFIQNEVVLQMGNNIPLADVQRVARDMGLSIISQQSLDALGRNAFRFSIGNGRSVRDVIRALEANSIVAVAQPNYQYKLSQTADTPAAEHKGDPAQYMVEKLQLEQVHRLVSGKNITIAVIDSEADKQHTELQGQISEQFNAIGEAEKAHSHGTAMVGAIASRDRLLGVAPGAKILAVRAFSESQQSAEGTTFNILKSIDWAVSQGARVINMSFAGPRDPALERTLKRAYDQGVVLIAAAGNAGPKSPPLYPGADPSVIAVTATDAVDRGFKMANQGPHVSVASPGVDVLAPAPQESYQMSTGTSIATAHVSGVVALMLERDPTLTPADVRKILESTATDLGPKGKDTQFGWGLVNPQKALQMVDERKRKLTEAQPAITTAAR